MTCSASFNIGGSMDEADVETQWKAEFIDDGFKLGGELEVGFQPVIFSFETSRIKDPLFGWLQPHG